MKNSIQDYILGSRPRSEKQKEDIHDKNKSQVEKAKVVRILTEEIQLH